VWKNQHELQDWQKVIKHFSLHFTDGHVGYHLLYHKADCFYCGTDILFTCRDITDFVMLLREYTVQCDALHGSKIALFLHENGTIPTCSWFDSKFFTLLDWQFGGHSAHAGGTTFYASLGLTEDIVQALGCWSSQAWKDYIWDNSTIQVELQLAALCLQLHS
jgi:hypothetical protein